MPELPFQEISRLLRDRGYDSAAEELLDFLWCSPWICHRISGKPPAAHGKESTLYDEEPEQREKETDQTEDRLFGAPEPPAQDPKFNEESENKKQTEDREDPESGSVGDEEGKLHNVYLDAGVSQAPARRVRIAGARPFGEAVSLAQALRPLRFGVERVTGELSEEETADLLARTGFLLPRWQRRKVSPFRIDVVVEATRGVLFWSAWIRHWVDLLRHGTRSPVTKHFLIPVAGDEGLGRRFPFLLSHAWPADRGGHPESLGNPGQKRLIFLFSDMMSPLWEGDRHLPALLHEWARHQMVTILNPLHRDLWIDSAWAQAGKHFAHCREVGESRWMGNPFDAEEGNGRKADAKSSPSAQSLPSPVFHLRLNPSALANWARTVTARAASGHAAIAWEVPRLRTSLAAIAPPEVPQPLDPIELRDRFRDAESKLMTPSGVALMRVLAAAPLTPAIIRLVQRAIYPSLTHEHISEIFRSGLLYRVPGQPLEMDPDRVLYDFLPSEGPNGDTALRDLFFNRASWDRLDQVRELVGAYIARQHGVDPWSVEALRRVSEGERGDALANELRPFARILGHVLGRFGERHASTAGALISWGKGEKLPPVKSEENEPTPDKREIVRPTTFTNSAGMTMLGIPSGTFTMGSPVDEEGRSEDETPHEVTLTQPFRIAATPVTQAQWKEVVGHTVEEQKGLGNDFGDVNGVGDGHPTYLVNWEDALRFCDALTELDRAGGTILDGEAYTLPTEAQWEYACRAGTAGAYNVKGAELNDLGWSDENSNNSTQPVGQKTANAWGLHDCHGNVWEWCADWFEWSQSEEPVTDPRGPAGGDNRVLRGGSWSFSARYCRSAARFRRDPSSRYYNVGFRPVLAGKEERAKLPALKPWPMAAAKPEPEAQAQAAKVSGPHGMTFVPVKAVTFTMGSPADEKGRWDSEDLHQVTLTRDFEMAETPVTQGQWLSVMGRENPSNFKESGLEAPVESVSWEDAVRFCEKLSAEDREFNYRLPTEAEWEFACRAGTTGSWNVERAPLEELGWHSGNSGRKTHPVKQKRPNALGLFDMHGNVLEWCQDWATEHLGFEPVTDPQGPESGVNRALRSGSCDSSARYCRSAARHRRLPLPRYYDVGFRPVRQKTVVAEVETQASSRRAELLARDFPVAVAPGMKMVALEGGTFTMGEGAEAHPVMLTEDFFMAETPVTQMQWQAVMGDNPSQFPEGGPDAPVENVSWNEARAFCSKLNELAPPTEGWEWALPTEAEWEYACRAGTTTAYSWGKEFVPGRSNVENSSHARAQIDFFKQKGLPTESTTPVKSFEPNRLDLYDMHGNVWEWCRDWYGEYPKGSLADPRGPETGDYRVLRGGSWGHSATQSSCAFRHDRRPDDRSSDIGFRPVLVRKKKAEGDAEPLIQRAGVRQPDYVAADFRNSFGMDMVCLEPATFTTGSPPAEEGREPGVAKETQHLVTLTQPFWIAKTPVTQGVWSALMGTTVAEQKAKGNDYGEVTGTGDNHPVYFVNWEEALAFCDQLSRREQEAGRMPENYLYTLPTEAQWEYACRAGTEGAYNVDGAHLEDFGWYGDNSERSTHSVGQKKPNAWGLHDCHGNVWEWCADWYQQDLGSKAATDPQGPASGNGYVLRGGAWSSNAPYCRSAIRITRRPVKRFNSVGFRPVLTRKTVAEGDAPEAEAKAQAQAGRQSGSHGMTFIAVPAGKFLMGSPASENGRDTGETQHLVTLTQGFEIAQTPVTQTQWTKVMGQNPSQFKPMFGGGNLPVESVSWEEAMQFCAKLTEEDRDYVYSLPTEAQWEYACRAGTKGPYNVDEVELRELGWFDENSRKKTHSVKEKLPNAWGLHDCHGNVWEWCSDWYQKDLGPVPATDPQGPETGVNRVLRGGCWSNGALRCRSAYRHGYEPSYRNNYGFRPVRQKRAGVVEPGPMKEDEVKAGTRSAALRERDFLVPVASGMKMVALEAGTFTMGEGADAHPVTLTEDFFIAETPVTQAQWVAVMGNNPSHFKQVSLEAPVEKISWDDATAFCARLNEMAPPEEGREWTLPSEAQWEYACRAGTTTIYSWGDEFVEGKANVENGSVNTAQIEFFKQKKFPTKSTMPVKTFEPNPWDLYDMHGNVLEWCADWYGEYPKQAVTDPKGAEIGSLRLLRGGSWSDLALDCLSASRDGYSPDDRYGNVGFRPVLASKEKRARLLALEPERKVEAKPEPKAPARAAKVSGPHGMTFISVPAGTFLMGSPANEEGRSDDEIQHEVTLTQSFEIAETAVTQAQWKKVMGQNPSRFKPMFGGGNQPVETVSWEEATRFCAKLSQQDRDYLYSLPTEAQWEYACRAGTKGPYNVHGAELVDLGWFDGNSGSKTHPVKGKRSNAWGLFDCHGNVLEWCADWYQQDLGSGATTDPQGPASGVSRVLRGGSWGLTAQRCRSAARDWHGPGSRRIISSLRPIRFRRTLGAVSALNDEQTFRKFYDALQIKVNRLVEVLPNAALRKEESVNTLSALLGGKRNEIESLFSSFSLNHFTLRTTAGNWSGLAAKRGSYRGGDVEGYTDCLLFRYEKNVVECIAMTQGVAEEDWGDTFKIHLSPVLALVGKGGLGTALDFSLT